MAHQQTARWIFCLMIVAGVGFAAALGLISDAWPWDRSAPGNFALRWAGATALVSMLYPFAKSGYDRSRPGMLTTWWDPASRPDGTLTWRMVHDLTVGFDPLAFKPLVREVQFWPVQIIVLVVSFVAGSVVYATLGFLYTLRVPVILLQIGDPPAGAGLALDFNANLTAFLALIAASISIVFTYSQLRAKVLADNRQAWIARLRTLIAEVVSLSHRLDRAKASNGRNEVWRELGVKRPELELMLNPRERDHRLLMYLIQRLSDHDFSTLEHIADARYLRAKLLAPTNPQAGAWRKILDCDDRAELTDYVLRLSHVVLKREWERVKRTR